MPMTKQERDELRARCDDWDRRVADYDDYEDHPAGHLTVPQLRELLDGAEEKPRKPVQIAGDTSFGVVVLADDGTLWHSPNDSGWYPLPPLPQGESEG